MKINTKKVRDKILNCKKYRSFWESETLPRMSSQASCIYRDAITFVIMENNLFTKVVNNEWVLGSGQCQKGLILLVVWKGKFPHVSYSIFVLWAWDSLSLCLREKNNVCSQPRNPSLLQFPLLHPGFDGYSLTETDLREAKGKRALRGPSSPLCLWRSTHAESMLSHPPHMDISVSFQQQNKQ